MDMSIFDNMKPNPVMEAAAKKRRATYEMTPNLGLINTEFGYYSLDAWKEQGKIEGEHDPWVYDEYLQERFFLEHDGQYYLNGANWEASEFYPMFEDKHLEDRGEDKEIVQDQYGREVLVYKRSRSGYMPEYVGHPVHDMESWKEKCEWRLNPDTEQRYIDLEKKLPEAMEAYKSGCMMVQRYSGGYMYLRSLIGPEELLYMVYDDPDLIHACMQTWFNLADRITAYHQQFFTLDELFIGEDITYNQGPLISPAMIEEFLFPYYKKLYENAKARQLDPTRKLHFHLDTDGFVEPVIGLYQSIGFDVFSPFEVASGSDVVKIRELHPDIIMSGGIDKRMYSASREELKEYLDGILPVMKEKGGYIPTCDHGVPEEANYENYVYYRKRCDELSK
ncbi:MAG: uroporphyrinogen decarboxylase family protein [Eubacteriales bacterium]